MNHRARRSRRTTRDRRGYTLTETIIALAILTGVVLTIGMGTAKLQRSVGSANIRTRAFARADVQIGMARAWPTWTTIDSLSKAVYNGTRDGLITSTSVSTDTTGNRRIKRITVTVNSVPAGGLPAPVVRNIAIAAP